MPDKANTISPVEGEPLQGVNPVTIPQATAKVTPEPPILLTQPDSRADVTTSVTSGSSVPSGTVIQSRVSEHFKLMDGSSIITEPYTQDLFLYSKPSNEDPDTLSSKFIVSPTRFFSFAEFKTGVIDIDISFPHDFGQPSGVLVGRSGSTVIGSHGMRLVIPSGALTENTPVEINRIGLENLAVSISDGFAFIDAVSLTMHGAKLSRSARITLPLTGGITSEDQILLTKMVEISDSTKLLFVGTASAIDNTLVTDFHTRPSLGVITEGYYLFLKSVNPLGFVTGNVTDAAGNRDLTAIITIDNNPIVSRSNTEGTYVIPSLIKPFNVAAINSLNGDEGSGNGDLSSKGDLAIVNINLVVTHPRVLSITPEADKKGVSLFTSIHVTFSEKIDPSTIIGTNTLTLENSSGNVKGNITLNSGGTVATFVPSDQLDSETVYTVNLAEEILDFSGNKLESFASSFTTADNTPPTVTVAGQVSFSLPANGKSQLTGTQGTVEPDDIIIVTNVNTGETSTKAANANGSFTVAIGVTLGNELLVTVQDQAGNRTNLVDVPFVDENGDPVTVMGSSGGAITGDDGVGITIPTGAIPDGTVVKYKFISEEDYPVAMPAGFAYVGGVDLDIGDVTAAKELKVSVPALSNIPADGQIIVAKTIDVAGELKLNPINIAALDGDRITTTSPPYPGVRDSARIAFLLATDPALAGLNAVILAGAADQNIWTAVIDAFPDFSYPVRSGPVIAVVPVNKPLLVTFLNQQGRIITSVNLPPVPPGNPVTFCVPVSTIGDGEPPTVTFQSPDMGASDVDIDATITVKFIEPMLPCTIFDNSDPLNSHFKLYNEDENDSPVEGRIEFENRDKTIIFYPHHRLKYGTSYRFELKGAQDVSTEILPDLVSNFKTFEPSVIGLLPFTPAEKNDGERAIGIDYIDNTCTVLLTNGPYGFVDNLTGFRVINVGRPNAPVLLGDEVVTAGRAMDIVTHTDSFAGRIAVVVSGNNRVFGNLRIFDVNKPENTAQLRYQGERVRGVPDEDETLYLGFRKLSTPFNLTPPLHVPEDPGVPIAAALAGDQVAYVATVPIGIQAVDLMATTNWLYTPFADRGPQPRIEGLYRGKFSDVDFIRAQRPNSPEGTVLAVGSLSSGRGFGLTVLDANLEHPDEVLNDPPTKSASRVKGLANFTISIDPDGDGIPEDKRYDLAFVAGGILGGLHVISLNEVCSSNSAAPCELGFIPTTHEGVTVPAFDITIDGPGNLVYVSSGSDPAILIFDISRMFDSDGDFVEGQQTCDGENCIDKDQDGDDDRILGSVSIPEGEANESVYDAKRGLLYLASGPGGLSVIRVGRRSALFDPDQAVVIEGEKISSANGVTLDKDVLVFNRPYGSDSFCINLDTKLSGDDRLNYEIVEQPLNNPDGAPGAAILSPNNMQGVLTEGNQEICLTIDSSPFDDFFGSQIILRVLDQQGLCTAELSFEIKPARIDGPDILTIATKVDRINGETCFGAGRFIFTQTVDAKVTLEINGRVAVDVKDEDLNPIGGTGKFEEIFFEAGTHSVILFSDTLPPGENRYILKAKEIPGYRDEIDDEGIILHEIEVNATLPIGHTMIKGVDIWDGHLTHSTQDIMIPGRGLSLDFTRTYSSAGYASDGPLGAGWTHSYNIRLIKDSCGRYVVIGGEGSGNAFRSPHSDTRRATDFGLPANDVEFFKPQIGYHSALVRYPNNLAKGLDFYTKAHIRYHFELDPNQSFMPLQELYILRFIEEPNGNKIRLFYDERPPLGDNDPTTLDQVTDASDRSLLFEYEIEVSGQKIAYTDIYLKKRIRKITGSDPLTGSDLDLELTYEYDIHGNLVTVRRKTPNPGLGYDDERVERYTYWHSPAQASHSKPTVQIPTTVHPSQLHNLKSYTDPNGKQTNYVYGQPQPVVTLTNIETLFGVPSHERVEFVNQPEGVTTGFTYSFSGKTRVVTDPRPNVSPTTYTLNDYGATVTIVAPMSKRTKMEWCTDAPHQSCNGGIDVLMVSKTDAEGRRTEYVYDDLGNLEIETIKFTGNKKDVMNTAGGVENEVVTRSTYDKNFSKMIEKTDAEGNKTFYHIDSNTYSGQTFSCTGGRGNTGNLLGVKDAESNITCYTYDTITGSEGNLLTVKDPRGKVTKYTKYDRYGNPEMIEAPDGLNTTTNRYDERSRLKDTSDNPFGHHVAYTYDGLDRTIRESRFEDSGETGTSEVTEYRYYANDELKQVIDGLGQITEYPILDGLNRVKVKKELGVAQVTGNTEYTTSYTYDEDSNVVTEEDQRGIKREHTYDELNRRTETKIVSGGGVVGRTNVIMNYTYDLVNNKLSEIDHHGHETKYFYDGLYRVVETHLPHTHVFSDIPFPLAAKIEIRYDLVGNKVSETDANGQKMTYGYDDIYRLLSMKDADQNKITYRYDRASNKIREENKSSGLVTTWDSSYDGLNRPTAFTQTGPGILPTTGYKTSYTYDDSDNAVTVHNPRGINVRTDKDGLDRVFETIVDPGGLNLITTYSYDGNGNVISVNDPKRNETILLYDGLNRKIRSTYAAAAASTVAGPMDPDQNQNSPTEEFTYDGNNNLTRYKDKRGIVFRNTYDYLDRLLKKIVEESVTGGGTDLTLMEYVYNDSSTPYTINETDANGNVTEKRYDGIHRLTTIDDPDPITDTNDPDGRALVTFEYDGVNKRAETDKKGHRTEYDYDEINRLVKTREYNSGGGLKTAPDALMVTYDDANNRVEETDRRTIKTTRQLDALQRLRELKRTGPDMATHYPLATNNEVLLETYEYDENSNKTLFIDGEGNKTRYTYDAADRLVTMTEGLGSTKVESDTNYTYDKVNNILTVKDGRVHGSTFDIKYDYDDRYRKISETNGEKETTQYKYDGNDNLVSMEEPKGGQEFTTLYRYDELNTLLAVDETQRGGGVTRFFYDDNRNKIEQRDAEENRVTYSYDRLNRLTDTFQHIGGTNTLRWQYGYDLNSNLSLIVDPKGQRVEMVEYDWLDRLVTKDYKDHDPSETGLDFQMQKCEYVYDGNSNITSITETKQIGGVRDKREVTTQTFDPLNRLQTSTHIDYDNTTKEIQYDYDKQGNRTKVIDPDGLITDYKYDERNRLDTVTTEFGLPTEGLTKYTWWEDSLLKKVEYPNGTVCDRESADSYDAADRLMKTINRPADPSLPIFSVYSYTYDENSNRWTQVETQRVLHGGNSEKTIYDYDNLNRLRMVTYNDGGNPQILTYTYERNGNRKSEIGTDPHTGQPVDRLYTYEELPGMAGVTFDGVNTLTQIVDNLDSSKSVTYEYDRNLNQTAKEKGGVRTEFKYGIRDHILEADELSGDTVTFDYDHDRMRVKKISGGTGKETRYLYDQSSVLVEYDGTDPDRSTSHKYDYGYELLSLTTFDDVNLTRDSQFYMKDGLMSTANLTDERGGLLHSYRYDAWGRIRDQVGTSTNPRQYTGHYKDKETCLHYFGARYYDEETGRFLSQDPYLGEENTPPSLHRYLYAYANPLRYVDLTGYQAEGVPMFTDKDIARYNAAAKAKPYTVMSQVIHHEDVMPELANTVIENENSEGVETVPLDLDGDLPSGMPDLLWKILKKMGPLQGDPLSHLGDAISKLGSLRDDYARNAARSSRNLLFDVAYGNETPENAASRAVFRRRMIERNIRDATGKISQKTADLMGKRNLSEYGDKLGPKDTSHPKFKGKSPIEIIESAGKTNKTINALGKVAQYGGKVLSVAGKGLAIFGTAKAGFQIGTGIDELISGENTVKGAADLGFGSAKLGVEIAATSMAGAGSLAAAGTGALAAGGLWLAEESVNAANEGRETPLEIAEKHYFGESGTALYGSGNFWKITKAAFGEEITTVKNAANWINPFSSKK
ncbi:MAG: Ig-like domain-containing protein [Candidatus Scalindua sp.]|nr:Ig-like domain-containing protein [Candidatus Scalindua sp.]